MKLKSIVAAVVVSALAAGTLPLIKGIRTLRWKIQQERRYADKPQLIPKLTHGIDVFGHLRNEVRPANATRVVLFGLRSATLSEDLRIWDSIASHLVKEPNVHLVGYCDGRACASAASRIHRSLAFAVIAYADPLTVQAVLNADAEGQALVVDGTMRPLRSMSWRGPNAKPSDLLVREVLK